MWRRAREEKEAISYQLSAISCQSSVVGSRDRRSGFTLIELVSVIAIIGILLGVVLPGVSRMWSQRNEAGAANMLKGLLASARSQAIRLGDRGIFFFSDEEGHQHAVFIEADPPGRAPSDRDVLDCTADGQSANCITEVEAFNRFRPVPGKVYSIPAPYRVTPLWVIDTVGASWSTWPQQLLNNNFPTDTSGIDTPRYHRSFFTVIFNARGELVVGRDVLIHDYDPDPSAPDDDGDLVGDLTHLDVEDATEYWLNPSGSTPVSGNIPTSESGSGALYDMVVLADGRAANFVSVAGLMVYDDSSLDGITVGTEIQDILKAGGQPMYVSNYTGEVVLGPRGE